MAFHNWSATNREAFPVGAKGLASCGRGTRRRARKMDLRPGEAYLGRRKPSDVSRCVAERKYTQEQARKEFQQVFIPECNDDGTYSQVDRKLLTLYLSCPTVQCHSYTGYCWCVTPNGRPISGTAVAHKTPRCPVFLGSKITADGDCSQEIKRRLLLGRKAMANLDSILKSRDITLPTKLRIVKAMVFPVAMYGCETWTIRKAERKRIEAFELWPDTEDETQILRPPNENEGVPGEESNAGNNRWQKKEGTAEDEMMPQLLHWKLSPKGMKKVSISQNGMGWDGIGWWWKQQDINIASRYPTLWTEQVKSRQNKTNKNSGKTRPSMRGNPQVLEGELLLSFFPALVTTDEKQKALMRRRRYPSSEDLPMTEPSHGTAFAVGAKIKAEPLELTKHMKSKLHRSILKIAEAKTILCMLGKLMLVQRGLAWAWYTHLFFHRKAEVEPLLTMNKSCNSVVPVSVSDLAKETKQQHPVTKNFSQHSKKLNNPKKTMCSFPSVLMGGFTNQCSVILQQDIAGVSLLTQDAPSLVHRQDTNSQSAITVPGLIQAKQKICSKGASFKKES
ncbi:SPARC-related modular calcium-binding protein 2 [Varanus komodoensis]|nr:SPARC-related modular calcium-binding protein 2 [Varanus komodoensis]